MSAICRSGLLLLMLSTAVGAAAGQTSPPGLRQAVVQIEVDLDAFSLGPEVVRELAGKQRQTPYEAELARRFRIGSTGTGFFVNARGDLVTNAHVVLSGVRYRGLPFSQSEWESLSRLLTATRDVWVTVGEGSQARQYVAALVAMAEDLDLAVLHVTLPPAESRAGSQHRAFPEMRPPAFTCLAIGQSDDLRVGQTITALGFPENGFQASEGKVLSLIHGTHVHEEMRLVRHSGPEGRGVTVSGTSPGPLVRLQHSAPTGHGSSGGPLLDARNQVIGVAYAVLADRSHPAEEDIADLNLAIASNVLKRFLREHAVPFTEAKP
jgi:S1-C subfamily serine protease